MEPAQSPFVTSFVIRFVREQAVPDKKAHSYRGTIHHVQSNQEIAFIRWQDAVEFIERFIELAGEDKTNL
jgi:hypothetical protein